MIRLEHGPIDPLTVHVNLKTRVYMKSPQKVRVRLCRSFLKMAMRMCDHKPAVCEIGCGSLDIAGKYAHIANVVGVDCNPRYTDIIKARWPMSSFRSLNLENFEGASCDVLVACEVLEHLKNPKRVMRRLMPKARYAIISHPIDEKDRERNDEHYWSFSKADFKAWFSDNNFTMIKAKAFVNGPFYSLIGLGRNNALTTANR